MNKETIHQTNQKRWEAAADNWAKSADSRSIWNNCHKDPTLVFCDKTLTHLKNIDGKRVAVLGSGDNEAVFALAGMGASVTSVDISQNQLNHAAKRAGILGFDITFIQQDVTDLNQVEDQQFDLVYTGGHVAVWVADLKKYYTEAARILKKGGTFIVEEYHPFRRVWKETTDELSIKYNYFNRGPFEFYYGDNVLYPEKGGYQSFEFHWTIGDFCTAILKAGCSIEELYEYGEGYEDWEVAPFKGLPEILTIVAKKRQH